MLCDIGADKWVVLAIERGEVDLELLPSRRFRRTVLHAAVSSDRVELVKLLLAKGANPTTHCPDGWATPLHLGESAEIAKLLLDAGAEIDAVDDNGDTPLTRCGGIKLVEKCNLLLDRGASVKTLNQQKRSVLHRLAAESSEDPRYLALFERLAKAGADFEAKDFEGKTAYEIASGRALRAGLRKLIKNAS